MHIQACSCMNSLYLIVWEWTCTTDLFATLKKWVTLRFNVFTISLTQAHPVCHSKGSESKRHEHDKSRKWRKKAIRKKRGKKTPSSGSPSLQPYHIDFNKDDILFLTLKSDNLISEGWNIEDPISKGLKKISLKSWLLQSWRHYAN